jgi:pyruvate oxidase
VTVTDLTELEAAFTLAATVQDGPIVIDVKIEDARPLPVEQLVLDTNRFTSEEIAAFAKTYQADGLTAFEQILEKYKA